MAGKSNTVRREREKRPLSLEAVGETPKLGDVVRVHALEREGCKPAAAVGLGRTHDAQSGHLGEGAEHGAGQLTLVSAHSLHAHGAEVLHGQARARLVLEP